MSTWILPCNINKYDVEGAFAFLEAIDWRQSTNVETGDVVYIYISSPVQAIKYKCIVIEANKETIDIDDSEFERDLSDNIYKRYMTIKKVHSFETVIPDFEKLNELGLKSVMGPVRASDVITDYLLKCEQKDIEKDNMLLREDIIDNVVIIKINNSYKSDMTKEALYEATRGIWKRKKDSVSKVEYALSVANQIVVEVYKIEAWFDAGTFPMKTRVFDEKKLKGRIEFTGTIADENIRKRYIGKSVAKLYKLGEADPLKTFFVADKASDNREYILDVTEKKEFKSIYEAINKCFGTDYTGWMKATWPSNQGNGKFRVWFPKLAETSKLGDIKAAAFDCINTISEDGCQIVFDDLKLSDNGDTEKYYGYDLIFAKEPKGGSYFFRGVFVRDTDASSLNHHVSKRVATKVKVIGTPATDIEILDDFRSVEQQIDINTPMEPKDISEIDGSRIVTCGRCSSKYVEAPRCPECGQLLKM